MPKRIAYIALSAFILLLPLLIVSAILALRFNKSLPDHAPFYNDEIYHWHQSRTFAEAGFNNGYYSLDENIPLAGFSHYYAWGAWVYGYYGLIGKIFGFGLNSLALINLFSFMAAAAFFVWRTRPSWGNLLCFGLVLATFIPLLLYLPSSLLEVLNMGIALILAAGFYRLLNQQNGFPYGLAAICFLAGLVRPTFALYLFPLFVLAGEKRDFKAIILAGLKAAPLILLAAVAFYMTAAPFPHFRSLLFLGDEPLALKLANFAAYIQQSIVWLMSGNDLVMLQRYQFALLIILLFVWLWRRKGEGCWEIALHLYNLLVFYLATILFHETLGGHDYRVMAVHLLFSLVLLAVMRGQWLVLAVVAISLAGMPTMWKEYEQKDANFGGYVQEQYQRYRFEQLQYNPNAPSPWCNTLISSAFYLNDPAGQPGMLLAVDAGFGLSWLTNWSFPEFEIEIPARYQIPQTFQSRYLLLTDEDFAAWGHRLNLRRLADAPNGALYINRDVLCR